MRGEAADLAEIVAEALRVAEEARDKSAQAAAKCLEGDVRKAQGNLAAAQVALEEGLAISQQLVEEDRENSVWQRGLGLAHDRMGDVLQAQGKLAAAHASFEKSLVISQRLAEQNPSDAEWLAIARGRAASIQQRRGTVAETPTYDKKRQIFERHALFAKLTRSEIDTLLTYTRVERYRAGRQIFAEGSPGDSMMVVLRGTVKISAPVSSGKEIVLNVINLGECFGEKSLLDGEERSADAIAMTDCELLVLNRRDFMPVLENHADICLILLKILCQRQRQMIEQLQDVFRLNLESRIAKALLYFADSTPNVGGMSIELHVSQRELGNITGGSRESINKHLAIMQRAGLIDLGKGSIVIRDRAAIERLL